MFKFGGFLLLLFFLRANCVAQTPGGTNQPVTIAFQKDSLSAALLKIQRAVTGDFAYDPSIVPKNKWITQNFIARPLHEILDNILFGTPLTYRMIGDAIVIEKKKAVSYTIDGHLLDNDSGEELIGATIYIASLHTGISSNQYGFYSLTLPEGDYELTISNLGFSSETRKVHLDHDVSMDQRLIRKPYDLKEISIESSMIDSIYAPSPARDLPIALLATLPYYAGEVDVIKALQMQNGVKPMTEGSSGLFVRGGGIDQNLITLDEAMIYNPSHLFGLVSVFNSDAIKKIDIYNDQIPANYGGRLSSVVDVRMADGNNKEFHLKGGADLLSLHLAAEGPIKKDAGSYLITLRRSLIDLLNHNFKIVNPNSSYYDLNLKANYPLNAKDKIMYSFYFGDDRLFAKNSYSNNWGNLTSTFRWNHQFNSQLFFNLSAIYSNYSNLLDVNADTISEKYRWKTGIQDFSLKGDFTFFRNPASELKFGWITTLHRFIPGEATNAYPNYFNIPRDRSWENALYISHKISWSKKLQLTYGLRAGSFSNGEDRIDQFDSNGNPLKSKEYRTYFGLEPRLYLTFLAGAEHRFHTAYNHNYQYLQLIQNNELTFSSLETWMPASAKTRPQQSDYWSAGYDYFTGSHTVLVNFYYKKLSHQLDLLNHTQVIKNPGVRDKLRSGSSEAYGAEFSASKTAANFTIEGSYSYSRVFRKIQDINNGERYRANYDVPHEFKSTQAYTFGKFSLSSFFTITSGRVATLPVGYYVQDGIQVPIFEGRNRSRFPVFHRWDLTAKLNLGGRTGKTNGFSQSISAGIYNVYNRKNPLFYRIKQVTDDNLSLFESTAGSIPWVAYNFKF